MMKKVLSVFNISDFLLILMAALVVFLCTSCAGSKDFQTGDQVVEKESGYHGYVWDVTPLGYLVLVRDNSSLDAADRTFFAHIRPKKVSRLTVGKRVAKGGRK